MDGASIPDRSLHARLTHLYFGDSPDARRFRCGLKRLPAPAGGGYSAAR